MGHVAVGSAQDLVTVIDSRWSTQGFTFTAVETVSDWADYELKVRTISAQVAVALGGGAAEIVLADGWGQEAIATASFGDVLNAAGTIDVQLAQEWLALQRHDPSQDSIEIEVVEVFRAIAGEIARDINRETVRQMADLFVQARGELGEDVTEHFGGSKFEELCGDLDLSSSYPLRHTIAPNVIAETTTR
jgi:hypothetical protein